MARSVTVVVVLLLATGAHAFIDECSHYPTCSQCLNVTSARGENLRANCGWCHVPIVYSDGTQGARCADIRDKPWRCPEMYETYYCTPGYVCDFSNGTCYKSPTPGEGYGNITDCQPHCFKTPDTYLCNTTSYQCETCKQGDPRCSSKSDACANCQQPPGRFTCARNATNATGQCEFCEADEPNCTDFKTACSDCFSPTPPPPPPPPPPPQTQYTCNTTSIQCVEAKQGMVIEECTQLCANSTPPNLVGVWRGIEAQSGFVMGEWDYRFTANTVSIRDPSGQISNGTVSTLMDVVITFTTGPHRGATLTLFTSEMYSGPETLTVGFFMGDYNQPAPYSIDAAFDAVGNARVHILSRCNDWKRSVCDFSGVLQHLPARLEHRAADLSSLPSFSHPPFSSLSPAFPARDSLLSKRPDALLPGIAARHTDPCNAFTTCSTCVGQREGTLLCGWCMGSTVVYNDTGDSGLHCAGFTAGQPLPFECARDFRTEDCTGYSCNYTTSQPQCALTADGTYSSLSECEQTCKAAEYAKCNLQTKQCEACTQGQPGCIYTKDECVASCALQYQRCNYTTHQCQDCDRATDPNCTASAGECAATCASDTHGVCDPLTGQCQPCDPSKGTPGCVQQCSATCTRSLSFTCDPVQQTCIPGQGNMTLQQCAQACANHTQPTYGCDWSNATAPMCVPGKGAQTLSDCMQNCHTVQYAACNASTGQCQLCDPTTPGCQYTIDYCLASCKKSNVLGVWRGIQINKGFKVAEYDFTFYPDGKVAFTSTLDRSLVYEAAYVESGTAAEGQPLLLTITKAPAGGPLPYTVSDSIGGLFVSHDGEEGVTRFLTLGLGLARRPATTFDDAMGKAAFVLTACKSAAHCDFARAAVPE